jgi:hypothetical protein
VNNKKVSILFGVGLSNVFVTSRIEKSNFYKDLEEVLDWKESHKNLVEV